MVSWALGPVEVRWIPARPVVDERALEARMRQEMAAAAAREHAVALELQYLREREEFEALKHTQFPPWRL